MKKFASLLLLLVVIVSCEYKPILPKEIPQYSVGDLVTLTVDSNSLYIICNVHFNCSCAHGGTYGLRRYKKVPISNIVQISSNSSLFGGSSSNSLEEIIYVKPKYIKSL